MTLGADGFEHALKALSQADKEQLLNQLCSPDFSGQLTEFSSSAIELASALLPLAKTFSVAPISGFHVGAIAVGTSGSLYLGANLEFANAPLSTTLHAEQSAVLNAWMHGEVSLQALVISEAPCGFCRQFLRELSNATTLPIIVGDTHTDLAQLLPMPFGEPRQQAQGLLDSPPSARQSMTPITSDHAQQAVDAAQHSYSPYTQVVEGVALESADGKYFTGRSAESSAFNPGVPAVVCALNQRNLSNSRSESIQACTHAKLATSLHTSSELTAAILRNISSVQVQTVLLDLA